MITLSIQAMNSIEPYDKLYTTVFHTLRKICVKNGILPTALSAATQDLLVSSDGPEAFGGFAEVWRGRLGDQDVGVKAIRISTKGSADSVLKVSSSLIYGRQLIYTVYQSFCREAITWYRLSHDRVVPFYGIDQRKFPLSMVCKWMMYGHVVSFVKDNPEANRPKLVSMHSTFIMETRLRRS